MLPTEQKLISLFKQLNDTNKASVLSYARFLLSENNAGKKQHIVNEAAELKKPEDIPRPESENVVNAIKRLTATYPMIDSSKVLGQATTIMTEHMMRGKKSDTAIDDLESLFSEHYEMYCQNFNKQNNE